MELVAGPDLSEKLASGPLPVAWRRLWDLVPATGPAIAADIERLHERGLPARRPWGVRVRDGRHGIWEHATPLAAGGARLDGPHLVRPERIWVGPDTEVAAGVCLDASAGPVVLDRSVRVMPQSYLAGPLYVGAGALVKPGTRIEGETSIGARCKVAGEIAESTLLDLANKAHDGFIGHAYLGSWVNLGAMTTCSDLKNNYGPVRADAGLGSEDTGLRFLGLMMGEHAKTAIGTLFNTGTSVGFASNVFATGFPPKSLPCFTWGDGRDDARQDTDRALATAETVMARRDCELTDAHRHLFRFLAG